MGRIPTPLSPLIGREREVAAVLALLRDPGVRLVTLTGPGGVGKTRLAIRSAELLADPGDDVAFLSLAQVRDPDLVLPAVAAALDVREVDERFLVHGVAAALRARPLLLVLDNLEQVLPAAPRIAALLAACPDLTVLTTSRSPLRLSGEHVVPVPPLGLTAPDDGTPDPPAVAELGASEAVRLFVERAQAARPGFVLDAANVASVAEICRRLDGLPLAIELAAARLRHLPPDVLLARLEQRLPLLTGGALDQPARLRTLRDAIGWSYDLLDLVEQALFRRLAVFAGGFTFEAAAAVVGTADELGVLEGIGSLIDKSLVRPEVTADGGPAAGAPRYGMLETIREFGLERLAASGKEQEVRRSHATWCRDLAERGWQGVAPVPVRAEWPDRLEAELDNLRAALAWLDGAGDADGCLRLAGALLPLWIFRSHRAEGRGWLERALAAAPTAAADARARALFGLGRLTYLQGDHAAAVPLLEESLRLWRALDDGWGTGWALLRLGTVALGRGDYRRARALVEEALTTLEGIGNADGIANCRFELGLVALGQGNPDEASDLLGRALALQRDLDDAWGMARSLNALALVAAARGAHGEAAAYLRKGLPVWRELGTKEGLAEWLATVATLCAGRGQPEPATLLLGAATALGDALGHAFQLPKRPTYERAQAAARAAIGVDRAATAWSAGRRLPIEPAVATAVAALDTLVPSSPLTLAATDDPDELTPREREVLRLLAAGRSNPEIADALFIGRGTAKTHVSNILTKLGARTRTEAADLARRRGLL